MVRRFSTLLPVSPCSTSSGVSSGSQFESSVSSGHAMTTEQTEAPELELANEMSAMRDMDLLQWSLVQDDTNDTNDSDWAVDPSRPIPDGLDDLGLGEGEGEGEGAGAAPDARQSRTLCFSGLFT